MELPEIIADLANALKAFDASAPIGRSKSREYRPGIGPLTEAGALAAAIGHLKQLKPPQYSDAGPKKLCDLVIGDDWAIEAKLIRPFGDNGAAAEHWSENILHPYKGNISSIGDCLKLCDCSLAKRKAVVVFGYEHTPPQIPLEPAVQAFELIAKEILKIPLGERCEESRQGLTHPIHQQVTVYGWELS